MVQVSPSSADARCLSNIAIISLNVGPSGKLFNADKTASGIVWPVGAGR